MEESEINKINIENNNIEEIDLTTKYFVTQFQEIKKEKKY